MIHSGCENKGNEILFQEKKKHYRPPSEPGAGSPGAGRKVADCEERERVNGNGDEENE